MKAFEGCQIKNWGKYTSAEGGHPVIHDRVTECVTLRPTIARRPSVPCWPSVTRRFSAGLTDNVRPEGKGVNALTEFLAWVNSPVVNDRGTERATPDRPHQKERTWSSVTRQPSVTRRFSAGHTDNVRPEGKGVNALTESVAEVHNPVVNDRGTERVSLRPTVPQRLCLSWRPSVTRRFSAGHKEGSQVEGKGVNALTESVAEVHNPVVNDRGTEHTVACGRVSVVNDRGTEHAAPNRPHQNERTWSSVTWWPSVTRRFSAGLTDNVRTEGKGVNALTESVAEVHNPVVNDQGTEHTVACGRVSVVNDRVTEHAAPNRPHQNERSWSSVNWWPSVTRRFSAGHKEGSQVEGKGVNALTVCTAAEVHNPVVNDRGTECTAADGCHPVANDLGTEHTAVCGGDLDYHTPSYFGNMLDLRTPALQRQD